MINNFDIIMENNFGFFKFLQKTVTQVYTRETFTNIMEVLFVQKNEHYT